QLAARLQHPHIVPLLAAGAANGVFYYTMPLVEGESLRSRLARQGELPVADAVRIIHDVADALAYAHTHGLMHRDIKPDNILLSGKHAMVTDFGVSKAISNATGPASITSTGMALGTPAYMSPEQAAADPGADHRTDIYALGVVAYELLTGHPPFAGERAQQLFAAHAVQAPPPITTTRGAVPGSLEALVMRCLEKRPSDRPQTAQAIVETLEGMATPGLGQPVMSPVGGVAARKPAKWRWASGIVAALLLAGALGMLFLNGKRVSGASAHSIAVLPFENLSDGSAGQ